MPKHDDVHFDDYTPQTSAKHQILTQYLPAYFKALKHIVNGFHYVDGFAGRGRYAAKFPGSPLLAMDIASQTGVAQQTSMSFVEDIPQYFSELVAEIERHPNASVLLDSPLVRSGKFHDQIDEILARSVYKRGKVATFSFIDPCGIEGMRMNDLVRLLNLKYSELLMFFNYEGVNRLLGGLAAGTADDRVLSELFGTTAAVQQLANALQSVTEPEDRERLVRDHFIGSLRKASKVRYLLPFRIEARDRQRTSHYLIHCCNSELGFKIMKDVMWEAGRNETDEYGRLTFLTDRERGPQLSLIRFDIEAQKIKILERLKKEPARAGEFKDDWVRKPEDGFSERVYGRMLIELEAAGKVVVYDKSNLEVAPAISRRKGPAGPTIGDGFWLRLA